IGTLPTQTDVKNRWPDGSIKFAILTAHVPDPGNDHPSTDYPITAATASSGSFTATSQPVSVLLNIGGSAYVATMPTDAGADLWLRGPLVQEWRTVVAPTGDAGQHPFLRVIFDARVYNEDGRARVSVTVENVLNQANATTTTYDVSIVADGQTVLTQ